MAVPCPQTEQGFFFREIALFMESRNNTTVHFSRGAAESTRPGPLTRTLSEHGIEGATGASKVSRVTMLAHLLSPCCIRVIHLRIPRCAVSLLKSNSGIACQQRQSTFWITRIEKVLGRATRG